MALPFGLSDIDLRQPQGEPHPASSAFYIVARDATTTTHLKCLKSTATDTSWAAQDTANEPDDPGGTDPWTGYHSGLDGTTIHVIMSATNRNRVFYTSFDTTTDTWGAVAEILDDAGAVAANEWSWFSGARSDGDLIATYGGDEKAMGTDYGRALLARRESGSWTGGVNLSAAGSVQRHQRHPTSVTTTNDRTHAAFIDGANGLLFSTYLGNNTFGHQDTVLDASADTSGQEAFFDAIQFDDSGTLKVRWLYKRGGDIYIGGIDGDSDTPTAITPIGPINTTANPDSAALTHAGNVQHVVFSVGAAQYHVETGAGNDTWGSETELRASGGGPVFSANVYDSGGDVLAFLYDDSGGTETYDEVSLGAASTTVDMALASFTLNGHDPNVTRQIPVDADAGSFSLTGQAADITLDVNVPMNAGNVTLNGHDPTVTRDLLINQDTGVFSLDGHDPDVLRSLLADMALAGFTFTGFDPTLTRQIPVDMAVASFTFNGLDSTVTRDLILGMDAGGVTFNGLDNTVTLSINVTMNAGGFALTGFDLTITRDLRLEMDAGNLSLNGLANTITRQLQVAMDAGLITFAGHDSTITLQIAVNMALASFDLTGQQADVLRALRLEMAAGGLTLQGRDLDLTSALQINPETGALVLNGHDLSLTRQIPVAMGRGDFTLTGHDAAVQVATSVLMDAGGFNLQGHSASVTRALIAAMEAAGFTLTGLEPGITRQIPVGMNAGTFTLNGLNADLTRSVPVAMDVATFTLAGLDAELTVSLLFHSNENRTISATRLGDLVARRAGTLSSSRPGTMTARRQGTLSASRPGTLKART